MRKTLISAGWEFAEAGADPWRAAGVPGCVHLDLLRQGLIPDPHLSQNELACRWVDTRSWSYRCSFEWQAEAALPHRALHFEGLDTVCSVWLNGKALGSHDTMFRPLQLDVSGLLVTGLNELRLDFSPAAVVGEARRQEFLARQGLSKDTAGFFDRSFVRKAQYMFGWDWGPRLLSCGIYRPVTLIESDGDERDAPASSASLREIASLARRPDEFGESLAFEVNERPLWIKGANWIPDHSFPSEVSKARLRERLEQAKDLGVNMLRVWGGGLYEQDAFYEICDELGILVWQDFMFACAYYPDEGDFADEVRLEAEFQVNRLKRHRCIALWCGNNENQMMFAQRWGDKDKQPQRLYGEQLYNQVLREVVQRLDPGRPYIEGSPTGGDDPNSGGTGDQHYWDVWHGRGDWKHYTDSTARFCSEFGFASSPSMEAWHECLTLEEASLGSGAMLWHDKTGKPWEEFSRLVELHYPPSKTLEDWAYYSQLNQRDALRHAIEHFRRSQFCKGTLIWQLNDCWPAQSWALIDFKGRYKAAAYELRRLYAPRLLSIHLRDGRAEVWAVSDDDSWQGEVVLKAIRLDSGAAMGEWRCPINLAADTRSLVMAVDLATVEGTEALFVATCGDIYGWQVGCEPKDVSAKPPSLQLERSDAGYVAWADAPIVDVYLCDAEHRCGFEDNYFTLWPGIRRTVRTQCPPERVVARCLAGSPTLVWN